MHIYKQTYKGSSFIVVPAPECGLRVVAPESLALGDKRVQGFISPKQIESILMC